MASTAPNTVHVSNLSPTTTKESLEKFLGFCGKVTSLEIADKSATVTFEREASAKTAEFLNGGILDGSTLHITGPSAAEPSTSATLDTATTEEGDEHPEQSDKPRSAIAAEYLAHGYVLGDHVVQQAIAADQKYGVSKRFVTYWNKINEKVQPTLQPHLTKVAETARSVDEKRGVSQKASQAASQAWTMSQAYYEKALASPYGQKVHAYYTQGAKTVLDVHEEAKRIAETKKAHTTHGTPTSPTAAEVSSGPTPVAETEQTGSTGEVTAATPTPPA